MVEDCLNKNILEICETTNKLRVNLDPRIMLLIREADCLSKMNIPIPVITEVVLSRKNYFIQVNDSFQVSKYE